MKIELDLNTDSYNTYCNDIKLSFEFFNNDNTSRDNFVWLKLDDREISVHKDELKKLLSIL